MRPRSIIFALVIVASLCLLAGCSSRPSGSEAEAAVTACLKSDIPISWVGNLMGGKNARISTIEVREWGSYNKDQKYWPAKVHVVGAAELNDPFNRGKVKQFDKVAEFRFRKDDYGKWEASLSGGMFQ